MNETVGGMIAGGVIIAGLLLVVVCCGGVGAYFESQTYNRLTGAKTTTWDALWVELRVQDSPKGQP